MTDARLVDVSLRDGNQSLWGAVGVTTRTVERVAPILDRVGYHAIELLSSTQLAVAVRFHREDPWQRIRAASAAMPRTTLGFLTTGKRFITFYRTSTTLFQLAFRLLRKHGVTRMWVIDPMHDMEGTRQTAQMAKHAGFEEVVGGICYTTSPVHTDQYYADSVAELDDCDAIDAVYLKDPAGLLTPERLRTLLPRLQQRLSHKRIDEIHSHCNTGMAPLTLLTAADMGVRTLHCALPPLANGSSHTSAPRLVANLRTRGHKVEVDLEAMAEASRVLQRAAAIRRLPTGVPAEYDEDYYRHTIPGGVISTLRRQLGEIGKVDLLPAVMEEAVRVRQDLGWPIVMTPFAQYIVTQATLNVMAGERYRQVIDEVIDLLLGDFGAPPGPVDPDLLDRAHSSQRARNRAAASEPPTLDQLRKRFDPGISDEDLLLRAVMPAEQVDAMVAERDKGRDGGLRALLRALEDSRTTSSVSVTQGGATISITRTPTRPEGAR
jgi:oxaloacetate decarboxylase (Na+ extruding) subunit alpha